MYITKTNLLRPYTLYNSQKPNTNTVSNNKAYSNKNISFGSDGWRSYVIAGVIAAGAAAGTYYHLRSGSCPTPEVVQEKIYNEKRLLLEKNMSEEEFMEKLKDIMEDDERVNHGLRNHKEVYQLPVFIEKMREVATEMYSNLSAKEKQEISNVRTFIKNAANNPSKDIALDILDGKSCNVMDKDYSKRIQKKALGLVTTLQKIAEIDVNMRKGGTSDEDYYDTMKKITELYFGEEDTPVNMSYSVKGLKQIRDTIANGMTEEELTEFYKEYDEQLKQYIENIDLIYDDQKGRHIGLAVLLFILITYFGGIAIYNIDP